MKRASYNNNHCLFLGKTVSWRRSFLVAVTTEPKPVNTRPS
uniref:Uncharacterized protein n=1 Tax=Nelumbo nucifera TaxID=4432 RepID=A0A822Z1Q5_NELNU|nr:TPA_asm: hypothetical protein HUJ06_006068 [Nelumbo nucifera]